MAFLSLLPILLALGFAAPTQEARVRSIVVEDHIIIRVPVRPPPGRFQWVERNGPKCIASGAIRGAFLSGNDHVDFLLSGRRLVRAKLDEDCPALDFYEGFYLNSEDERICAKRDFVRSRMGGRCRIERFRALQRKLNP
jgi:hypothetical protein